MGYSIAMTVTYTHNDVYRIGSRGAKTVSMNDTMYYDTLQLSVENCYCCMLSVILLNVIMLSVILLSVIMLSVIMLSVILMGVFSSNVIMLSHFVEYHNVQFHFGECSF